MSVSARLGRLLWPIIPHRVRIKISGRYSQLLQQSREVVPRCDTAVFAGEEAVRSFFPHAQNLDLELIEDPLPFSLLLTCKNEAEGILEFLDSLACQTRLPDEVVIVDGGSDDRTVELIHQWHDRVRPQWRYSVHESPGASIAAGRNAAMRLAQHSVLVCTDAGVVTSPTWCEKLLAPFRIDSETEVVAGWYEYQATTALHRGLKRFIVPSLSAVEPERVLPSARSFACRREVWERAGGFPEYLSFAGEDTLFMLAARSLCRKWAFVPEATVVWQPPQARIWRMLFRYAKGDGEAGLFMHYYLGVLRKFTPLLADIALSLLGVCFSLFFTQFLLALLFFGWLIWLLVKGYRLLLEYQPFVDLEVDGCSRFDRLSALSLLVSAQYCGVIRGILRRTAVWRRRVAESSRAILVRLDTPLVYPSAEFLQLEELITEHTHLVVVYQQSNADQRMVIHPRIEQWPASAFDIAGWEHGAGVKFSTSPTDVSS